MQPRYPVDREAALPWVEVAHNARYMDRFVRSVGDPAGGSNFARIDPIYGFEKASDWHRMYLAAALEHLLVWADLVAPLVFHPDLHVTHNLRPVFTLSRAALEAASQAVWMSAGETAEECARRHLSLIRWDYEEHRKSASDPDAKARIKEMDTRLLSRMSDTFSTDDLRPPGLLAVLRHAAVVIERDPTDVERIWRAASGAAHGKRWPSLELQHHVPLHEYEPGQVRMVSVPDPAAMTEILQLADKMTTFGGFRHADFSGVDIPPLMDETRRWLASVVPFRDDADPSIVESLRR